MATWYCDYTNGNDTTGVGTSLLPYKTIQKSINVATGGDTINVANTSAQMLVAPITWNTGWTADNTKVTTIQSWDNGGSITIQRPDEATARVGATIDSNAQQIPFASTSYPQKLRLLNLKFTNSWDRLLRLYNEGSVVWGCEFYGNSNGGIVDAGTYGVIGNTYIHGITATGSSVLESSASYVINNFIEDCSTSTSLGHVNCTFANSTIAGNIIKLSIASNRAIYTNSECDIYANTIISDGDASHFGISIANSVTRLKIYNNLFYNLDGASANPINFGTTVNVNILGNNAFFDCNTPSTPATINLDLTANDITGSGDPFVNSAGNDYSVTGSTAEDAGLGNP